MTVTVLKMATSTTCITESSTTRELHEQVTPCITESSTTRELYEQVQHAVMIEYFQASEERVCSQTFSVFEAPRCHGAVC